MADERRPPDEPYWTTAVHMHDEPFFPIVQRVEPPPKTQRRAPPQKTASFTQGTILKAVRLFAGRSTQNDVAKAAKLTAPDARRVRLMYDGGLLDLNKQGKLWIDERVRRAGRRIVLRYWGDDGRSLDPIESPPP